MMSPHRYIKRPHRARMHALDPAEGLWARVRVGADSLGAGDLSALGAGAARTRREAGVTGVVRVRRATASLIVDLLYPGALASRRVCGAATIMGFRLEHRC
jgi:hypothetical protein